MQTTSQQLFALTADDLMSRDVITLSRNMSLADVSCVLERFQIGGAPVVDAQGRCIGVFATVDFLRQTKPGNRAARMPPPVPGCACSEWKIIDSDDWDNFSADSVNHYMTTDPSVVAPTTRLGELAETMVDAHIHRLIVVDADRRPIGIVSSTDVLAAIARAAKEQALNDHNIVASSDERTEDRPVQQTEEVAEEVSEELVRNLHICDVFCSKEVNHDKNCR